MNLKKIAKTFAFTALFTLSGQQVAAQDLLARQAPVDKKMKAVDTLTFQQLLDREYSGLPAEDLYADWENKYAHRATQLPDEYKIDLRDFCMPTPSRVVTSNFGPRWGRQHKGLDLKVYVGDTIRSAFSGMVRMVKYEAAGYGKYIVIRHDNGLETIYGHLSKQLVRENQRVKAGDVIGLGGNTGRSTGSHLHFETRLCGVALNPAIMFDFRAQDVTGDFYVYRKSTYNRESAEATRLRGVRGNGSYDPADVHSTATAANRNSGSNASSKQKTVASAATRKVHKVKAGETLYRIATKYGVSVEHLRKLNGLGKNANIRAGQLIRYS
ncbi:MAG: peptidoglycan DD-metalloendopeptidase family protein [Prevotella sp.]|nr:peptidoglycan DD-metalloendopeptidase family protein [Prevotella sp.]